MGERQTRPFGFHLHLDALFSRPSGRTGLPSHLVLPGPLGTAGWNLAGVRARQGHATGTPVLPTPEPDYDKLYADILVWEGMVRYMYLDTHLPPLVTVGAGNMLPDIAAAQALPFFNTESGEPATKAEIATAFQKVAAMKGGMSPPTKYRLKPSIEITEEKAKQLAIARLKKEFIPGVRRWAKGFDRYPLPAREALIDMAYNGGVGRDAKVVNGKMRKANGLHMYTHLKRAVEDGDWQAAAKACRSSSSRAERNDWRSQLFEQAARIAAQGTKRVP